MHPGNPAYSIWPFGIMFNTMEFSTTRIDINSQELKPSPESVARYFGGSAYRLNEKMRRRVCESIDRAFAMVDPAAGYRVIPVAQVKQTHASSRHDSACSDVARDLMESTVPFFGIYLATLGDALEEAVRDLSARNEMVAAMALDATGTAMLDALGRRLESAVDARARQLGFFTGCRLGPGLNDTGMEIQALLFDLFGTDTLGVRLNTSLVMQPVKSISAFVILTDEEPLQSGGNKCSRCRMKRCQFRLHPDVERLEESRSCVAKGSR